MAPQLDGRAGKAPIAEHPVEAGRAQPRVLLEGRDDEGLVGVE